MANFNKVNVHGVELDIQSLILSYVFSGSNNEIIVCNGSGGSKKSGFYARYATSALSGFVVIGDNIDVNTTGKISVPVATATKKGVVSIGSNIDVNSGEISVPVATATKKGVVLSQKTGTATGRDYVIEVGSDGKMKTNVPWKNYSAGTHITITNDTTGVAPTIKTDIPAYPTGTDKGSKFLAGDGTWKSMSTVEYAEKAKYLVTGPTAAVTSATVHASDDGDLYAHTLTLT